MSWLYTVLAAFLTGAVCGAGTFWLSDRVVQWYRVSSFEGYAGYVMVSLTLLGTLAAVIVGLIAARAGVALGWAGFGGQLLWALGTGLIVLGVVAAVTRALADVPPTLRGRTLDLLVEIRFPPGQVEPPVIDREKAVLQLGAMRTTKRVVRARRRGELQWTALRQEEGRWILPGQVELFTSRGRRILWVEWDGHTQGFLVPLPARPGERDRQWSAWLPHPRPDGQPPATELTYRYRVEPATE